MKEYMVSYSANGRMVEQYFNTERGANESFRYCVNRCKRVEMYEDGNLVKVHVER